MYKSLNSIRQEFLNFFQKKEHCVVASSSLIPDNDHTLLFTNAGMNQFKNIFLTKNFNERSLINKRVTTVQRCMRAGGKHNDLDNVGYTKRHLTFFEMLGNFSFGDYFKNDAIQFAVELLTDSNWFNLSIDKLWITIHINDNESYDIWSNHIGIPDDHLVRVGNGSTGDFCNSENFWKMGNVGPCGPCSEIFYDRGDSFSGEPPGNIKGVGDRYIEIWNLVFIQFERKRDGVLLPLSMLSVDTGMGLERIALVLQETDNVFSIDVFKNLIQSISQIIEINNFQLINNSLYVIADHIRACSFLIGDGIIPSNDGRGYVLRRIIRRAILHGKKIGINQFFFYKLVESLINTMHPISDVLYTQKSFIEKILLHEEQLFKDTLSRGLELLKKKLVQLQGNVLNGKVAFDLHSTHGLPIELIQDVCYMRGITIDQLGLDQAILQQKEYTRRSNQLCVTASNVMYCDTSSQFVGYHKLDCQSKVIALFQKNELVQLIDSSQEESMVVLNSTPFYGEFGGQIGDSGQLRSISSSGVFKVVDTKKYGQAIVHIGSVDSGVIRVGEYVIAQVDSFKRKRICSNHSATHLLRAALCKIFGSHVVQKGSLVHDQYLRFDFSYNDVITLTQINSIENLVNQQIWKNLPVRIDIMSIEAAKKNGVVMLTNKEYTEEVRVLNIGNFSIELCGGTHVKYTGEIGLFIITKLVNIASGIKRIEATTERIALSMIQSQKALLQNIVRSIKSNDTNVLDKIHEFKRRYQGLVKEVECLKNKQIIQQSNLFLIQDVYYINNIQVLIKQVQNLESRVLLNVVDHLKNKLRSGIVVIINIKKNDKIHMVIGVTKDLIECNRVNALDLIHYIVDIFGGSGGGRSDCAQAGISNIIKKSEIIIKIRSVLHKKL